MPFRSVKQMREMFANQPSIAKRWAKETPDIKSLPEYASTPSDRVDLKHRRGGRIKKKVRIHGYA